jgi:hypothetical protein
LIVISLVFLFPFDDGGGCFQDDEGAFALGFIFSSCFFAGVFVDGWSLVDCLRPSFLLLLLLCFCSVCKWPTTYGTASYLFCLLYSHILFLSFLIAVLATVDNSTMMVLLPVLSNSLLCDCYYLFPPKNKYAIKTLKMHLISQT